MNISLEQINNFASKIHDEVAIYIFATCPFGVMFNAVLLGLMIKNIKKFKSLNIFGFISLAMNDLLVSLIGLPFAAHLTKKVKSYELCLFFNYPVYSFFMGSFLTIFVISVERFIAIIYPLYYNTILTARRIKLVVLCLIIYSTIINILPLLGWSRKINENFFNNLPCNFLLVHTASYLIFYCIGHMVFFSFLTFIMYLPVARVVYIQRKQIETKVLVGIICFISQIIFQILAWLPFFFTTSYVATIPANERLLFFFKNTGRFKTILYLFCIYPVVNPLIYGYSTKEVRKEIIMIFSKLKGRITSTSDEIRS